jgi:hypothetical protein
VEEFLRVELHEEYAKRMDEEHKRQNQRISILEKAVEQNNKLLISVEKLALSIENMQKELEEQGEKLEDLENRDGQKWRDVSKYVLTTIVGLILGYLAKQIGL